MFVLYCSMLFKLRLTRPCFDFDLLNVNLVK